MFTIDEIKTKLSSIGEDGVDKASTIDELLTDISGTYSKISEMEKAKAEADEKITSLSDKANELTQTNLKLLDKIKYVDEEGEKGKLEDDKGPEVEIADLTTWYEED